MKGIRVVASLALVGGAFFLVSACKVGGSAAAPTVKADPVERGRYLVTVGGCQDCHSPKIMGPQGPQPDPARAFSGHPANAPLAPIDPKLNAGGGWLLFSNDLTTAVGPWGVSFSANLTPDKETGIGAWPEAFFIATIRNGKHMGSGRPLLPPMPWQSLALASDDDLEAMFAYLQTVKPVHNQVPQPITPDQLASSKS